MQTYVKPACAHVVRTVEMVHRGLVYQVFEGSNGVILIGRNHKVKGGFYKSNPSDFWGVITQAWVDEAVEALR
jgi:hypothetical protein